MAGVGKDEIGLDAVDKETVDRSVYRHFSSYPLISIKLMGDRVSTTVCQSLGAR